MKTLVKLGLIVGIITVFVACDKNYEENLQGEWKLTSDADPKYEFFWYFNSGKVYFYTIEKGKTDRDTCNIGNYLLKNGVITVAAPGKFCNHMTYIGDWEIQKLNNTNMTLMNNDANGQGGVLWYEFIKK